MAASKDKAILFGRASVGKTPHLWPIAVFNTERDARSHVALLRIAYKASHDDLIKQLDPAAVRDENGNAILDTRWSVKVVPYAPVLEPDEAEDDDKALAVT